MAFGPAQTLTQPSSSSRAEGGFPSGRHCADGSARRPYSWPVPRSPLPQRHGLDAAWLRTPGPGDAEFAGWPTIRDFLVHRLPRLGAEQIDRQLTEGRFVDERGTAYPPDAAYAGHRFIWFHRTLPTEVEVPFDIEVLHRDENIVVIDKPHFLSTIPRGQHVLQSVVVRARAQLDLPELTPAHRLDRVTAGVLLLTTRRAVRGAYQTVFENRLASKEYLAVAPAEPLDGRPGQEFPVTVRSHIRKTRGVIQAYEVPGEAPNAETAIERLDIADGLGLYRLLPHTGRTHQLRLHLNSLGLPIVNDPFYPVLTEVPLDDFSSPLQLLASSLAFPDPLTGEPRRFTSRRRLSEWPVDSQPW